jgi:carbon monoxide dehydrogenase subunit G
MDLTHTRHLDAGRDAVWNALNDPEKLRAAIPGCESIEKTGENEYLVALTASVGPVRAKFRGRLQLADIVPPESYTLRFEGQGGAAGFANGTAQVKLAPEGGGTRLDYSVHAQVGGKLAQAGQRLINAAAAKLADDFFAAFSSSLAAGAGIVSNEGSPRVKPALGSLIWTLSAVLALLIALVVALR